MSSVQSPPSDVVNAVLGVDDSSPIGRLRNEKPELARQLQDYYSAIFDPVPLSANNLPVADRALIAMRVASHTGSTAVVDWYAALARKQGAGDADSERAKAVDTEWSDRTPLGAAIRHADLVTTAPAATGSQHLQALKDAGYTPAGILSIAQTIAFVNYQLRFIAGLRALGDGGNAGNAPADVAARRASPGLATQALRLQIGNAGVPAPEGTFTLDLLEWSPWLERATDTDLSPEQRERVEAFIGSTPNNDYINVLANDFEALQARALVHRHVYAADEPQLSALRELGATTTSRINGCVFCASVHARMYANYSKQRDVIQRFLDEGPDADVPPVERAVVDLGEKLTLDPESLTAADLQPLRDQGLDDLTILDIINYTAFFANANRLMLTLGEPRRPARSR